MSTKGEIAKGGFCLKLAEEPAPDMMSIMAVVFGLMGLLLKVRNTNIIDIILIIFNFIYFLSIYYSCLFIYLFLMRDAVQDVCLAISGVLHCIFKLRFVVPFNIKDISC